MTGFFKTPETFGRVLSNIRQTGHCVDANTLNLPER